MINKYRKKPIVIDAIKFSRDNFKIVESFTNNKAHMLRIPKCMDGVATCIIDTLEGPMNATEGDFIIKGINGEFYPCKPDIFNKTYESI